jgi:hypothetical protein
MKTTLIEPEEVQLLRQEFLSPDEIFLLAFMNSFNRKNSMEWAKRGLWEATTSSYT